MFQEIIGYLPGGRRYWSSHQCLSSLFTTLDHSLWRSLRPSAQSRRPAMCYAEGLSQGLVSHRRKNFGFTTFLNAILLHLKKVLAYENVHFISKFRKFLPNFTRLSQLF